MKITKAEGYKKPKYAVAVAATMTVLTMTGCGSALEGAATLATPPEQEVQLGGEATLGAPPEEQQVVLAGDVAEPVDDVIELDGYVTPYVDEEGDEIDDYEDKEVTEEAGEIEDGESEVYCEPIEDDLMLSGSVEVYEP